MINVLIVFLYKDVDEKWPLYSFLIETMIYFPIENFKDLLFGILQINRQRPADKEMGSLQWNNVLLYTQSSFYAILKCANS